MRLNTIKPALGARCKRRRIGRGMGSGLGKTCGFGHKGQKARSGYGRKVGFEGGQMPLQRRLPQFGFKSQKEGSVEEVQLHELAKLHIDTIDIAVLRKAKLVSRLAKGAKIILAGKISKAVTLVGLKVTAGARLAIEKTGGTIK